MSERIDKYKENAAMAKKALTALEEEYIQLRGLTSAEHIEWARRLGKAERTLLGHRDDIRNYYHEQKANREE